MEIDWRERESERRRERESVVEKNLESERNKRSERKIEVVPIGSERKEGVREIWRECERARDCESD